MLAVAYVIRLEDLARDVQALTTAAATALALGADVALPEWEDSRARFDAALSAPPAAEARPERMNATDEMKAIKMRALSLPTA